MRRKHPSSCSSDERSPELGNKVVRMRGWCERRCSARRIRASSLSSHRPPADPRSPSTSRPSVRTISTMVPDPKHNYTRLSISWWSWASYWLFMQLHNVNKRTWSWPECDCARPPPCQLARRWTLDCSCRSRDFCSSRENGCDRPSVSSPPACSCHLDRWYASDRWRARPASVLLDFAATK